MKSSKNPYNPTVAEANRMVWYFVIYQIYDRTDESSCVEVKAMADLESATKIVEQHPDAQVIKGVRLDVIPKHMEIIDSDKVRI